MAMESTATTKGNKHLRAIIVQVAWVASHTKGSFFMDKFAKLAIRKSRISQTRRGKSQHKAKTMIFISLLERIYGEKYKK
jgi:hypothetical protein